MSSNESSTLKLNLRPTSMRRIAVASEAMRRKKRISRGKTIEVELTALMELNCEYADSSREDRLALDELNAEGEELKRELAVQHCEQMKLMLFWDVSTSSARDAVHAILHGARKPLHYREITDRMLRSRIWISHGCTPWNTVNSAILAEMAHRRAMSRFVWVRPGVYGLREWADQDAA